MKYTRIAIVLAMTSLAATPSIAASLTMVQFGSFETREEAEKRLDEMKSKHGTKIAGLAASVREVKLPPDNLTVYRTQAGPVENRAAAQAICAQLASAGDECYIVQTAMIAPSSSVASAAAAPAPAPAAPANSVLAAPVTSVLAETPKQTETATADAPSVTSKLESLKTIPARDPSNREALSSVAGAAPAASEPVVKEMVDDVPASSPELTAALDKAVADKQEIVKKIDSTTLAEKTESKPSRSFWQRLNPFSAGADAPTETVAAAAPAAVAATALEKSAAPVEPVSATPIEEATAQPVADEPMKKVDASPIVITQNPVVVRTAAATDISPPQAMRLPPPPAPLNASDREQLSAPKAPQQAPEPIVTALIAPPEVSAAPSRGSVNVEEAKRVPLTQNETPPASPAVASPVILNAPVQTLTPATSQLQPPVSLVPSSTNGLKTIWAQIGPFADSNAALNFWANYRQAHPDFPVVRVRVTTPYQQQLRGNSQAWLRVGPVARSGFIKSLCTSLPQEAKLSCGHITDLGIAASPNQSNGLLPNSRYRR